MKNLSSLTFLAFLIFILISCQHNKKNNEIQLIHEDSLIKQKQEWLKEYALCSCIRQVYSFDSVKGDLSFSVLHEISDYDPKSYDKIDRAAKKAVLAIKPSQIADYNGKRAYLMSCIDFYRSKTLDSLIKTFSKPIL